MTVPDWQLPTGVDRGLWDYLHNDSMVAAYDEQTASPLARVDVAFCEEVFDRPGRLADLGCGTGRLAVHFARKGYECVGVDLSDAMLERARENARGAGVAVEFVTANLVDLAGLADGSFDYAACLFSTLGMIRGSANRAAAVRSAARILKPGGRFVLHVHNRWYRGLGRRRILGQLIRKMLGRPESGDITMPQAHGGARLTLHHFARWEAEALLIGTGFQVLNSVAVTEAGEVHEPRSIPVTQVYGYLFAGEKR